jgi:hypothetical protein
MTFFLQPRTMALRFFAVVAALTTANGIGLFFYHYLGGYGELGEYFDLALEGNIPTLYSAVAILLSAVLLWVHGLESRRANDGQHRYWFALAAIMAFLGVDEAVVIHEQFSTLLERFLEPGGLFYFLWVIPYGIGTVLLGLVFLRFLLRLPRRTARLFVVAGAIFVLGAIAVEMVSARAAELHGTASLRYSLLYTLEEFLEMTGIVVFIYALLDHGARGDEPWTIRIARSRGAL